MKRCTVFLVAASVLPVLGCRNAQQAEIEHGNVCMDLSPDGESIVFSSADGDLYLFDIQKRVVRQLTDTERTEGYPSFSPNGQRIVFASSDGNGAPHHIFVLDLATLETKQITDGPKTSDILPRFRSDGERIVFARAYRHRPYSFGGWTWNKWDACEIASSGAGFSRLTTAGYYQMYRIVPRSDGSIIYAADMMEADEAPIAALYSADSTGKIERLIPALSEGAPTVNGWATDPMLAADGVTLAYCSDRQRSFWYDVCVAREAEQPRCLVGSKSRYNRYPDFSPDGSRVVFLAGTEFNGGNRPLYSLWEVSLAGKTSEIAPAMLFTDPLRWQSEQRGNHKRSTESQ